MYGQTVLFLCIAMLVECTMCTAGNSRPHQYHEKEGNKLTTTAKNNQISSLETERKVNQTHTQFRRASKLARARDVTRFQDEDVTYPTYLQRRASHLVDLSEEENKISSDDKHLIEGVGRPDGRSATNMTKSTPPDIQRLFEDKSGTSTENTHLVEGGGEPQEILATSILRSPKPTSLTTSYPTSRSTTTSLPSKGNIDVSKDVLQSSVTNEDPKSHKTVPRKGAEAVKIFGRKGVDEETSVNTTMSNVNNASLSNASINISSYLALADDLSLKGGIPSKMVSLSTNAPPLPSNNSSNVKEDTIESNPPLKKKPKPLKLSDTTSFDTSPVAHDHVPSQRDIVLPVVGLILAVPMILVLGIFLYKKGSDYWSRRHYRRMDFLIDGMYND